MWFFIEFWTGIVFEHDVQSRGVCSKWHGLDGRKHAALGTFSRLNAWRMSKILALLGLVGQSKCMLKSPRIRSLPWWRLLYSRKSRNSVKNRESVSLFFCLEVDGTDRKNAYDSKQWVWLWSAQMMSKQREMRSWWWQGSCLCMFIHGPNSLHHSSCYIYSRALFYPWLLILLLLCVNSCDLYSPAWFSYWLSPSLVK